MSDDAPSDETESADGRTRNTSDAVDIEEQDTPTASEDERDDTSDDDDRAADLAGAAGDAFRETADSGPKTYVSERSIDDDLDAADESPGGGPRTHVSEQSVDDMLDDIFSDGPTSTTDADDSEISKPTTDRSAEGDSAGTGADRAQASDDEPATDVATESDRPADVGESPASEDAAATEAPHDDVTDVSAEMDDDIEAVSESDTDDGSEGDTDDGTESDTDDGSEDETDDEPLSADEVAQALADAKADNDESFGRPKSEGAEDVGETTDIGDLDLGVDDIEVGGASTERDGMDSTAGPLAKDGVGGDTTDTGEDATETADADGVEPTASDAGDASTNDDRQGFLARLKAWLFG